MLSKKHDGPSSRAALPAVYVVDDHPEMCRSLDALLSSYGFEVTCFNNPLDFVEKKRSLGPGVLLLDLRMPQMNGLEVLAAIQADLRRFQTIVITAHGEIDIAVKAIKLGAKDFIQKPFRGEELLAVIQHAVDGLEPDSDEQHHLFETLSPRERDVVLGLSRGVPNKVVAHQLGISVRTVEMHRARAMQRLGCKTFADMLRRVFNAPSVDD
jgi:two-component system response regulator FixJ